MRTMAWVLAGLLALGATGCDLSLDEPDAPAPSTAPADVPLTFAFKAINKPGLIDQTLAITNSSETAKAPVLAITPLAADGSELADVVVQTALGSDAGQVVVPADTEVLDFLRFKGADAAEVTDVRVEVTDEGVLTDDVPPANDLVAKRFDGKGKPSDGRTASLSVTNTYDVPVTVRIVGIEFDVPEKGVAQQFRRLSALAGPLTIAAGDTFTMDVDKPFSRRYFGSVKAFLTQ